ncbi:NF038132 family protein [Ideonella livida]|uniref:PEP-CTERM sorting domain-containing protein n=1 Tax=Ideonella livida TaxID=2707176 RepID=A0A7C9TMM1_9BURK|nr:NF038132 family protein [Ideonella livida]NDY93442.1 PEP-CTERM sorting domain-containing protein [Ideonella livida]
MVTRLNVVALAAAALVSLAPLSSAWAGCVGDCGTATANGVVTAAPVGNGSYSYVSTAAGATGAVLASIGGVNGSVLTSDVFSAAANDALAFNFDYVTSDGAGFADYAWARLMSAGGSQVAMLFTARTVASGSVVPGTGMPAPTASLNPSSVSILSGTTWAQLGTDSGRCYSTGCGHTGWVNSSYTLTSAGNYYLEFGVANWGDTSFDSGMAVAGITVAGQTVNTAAAVPEPESWALLMAGLGAVGIVRRRRRRQSV